MDYRFEIPEEHRGGLVSIQSPHLNGRLVLLVPRAAHYLLVRNSKRLLIRYYDENRDQLPLLTRQSYGHQFVTSIDSFLEQVGKKFPKIREPSQAPSRS